MLALRSKSASPMKSGLGNFKGILSISSNQMLSTGQRRHRGTSLSPRKLKFDMIRYTECIAAGKCNYNGDLRNVFLSLYKLCILLKVKSKQPIQP